MSLLAEALNECCCVVTGFGSRFELTLRDYDSNYALFKDKKAGIVILPLTEIRALEFEDDKDKDRECLRDEDT